MSSFHVVLISLFQGDFLLLSLCLSPGVVFQGFIKRMLFFNWRIVGLTYTLTLTKINTNLNNNNNNNNNSIAYVIRFYIINVIFIRV